MFIRREIGIDAPVQAVFVFVEDVPSYGQWAPLFSKARIEATMPLREGDWFQIHTRLNNKEWSFSAQVTLYEPPVAFSYEIVVGKWAKAEVNYDLEDDAGATRLKASVSVAFLKWYLKIVDLFLPGDNLKQDAFGLKRLKTLVEATWAETGDGME
ncbi:MAG: Polyketide cyclase / dehydrase and lipid transport [Candidatus Hydrogenedentes bacterium]|nr:Polyketide cyclase / dehydrase and lipid transport [Candidatus Hydrogenedentota bacterium]